MARVSYYKLNRFENDYYEFVKMHNMRINSDGWILEYIRVQLKKAHEYN